REAWFRLAQELFLLGRYAEAHRACERLIALSAAPGHTVPPEELARYYDYLGRIAESSGDTGGAVRADRRATDVDPSRPPAAPRRTVAPEELARYYAYLGRIAGSSGDTGGAVRAYRRAIDLDPSYPPAALSLARRAVASGDRPHAQALIDDALRSAEGRGPQ